MKWTAPDKRLSSGPVMPHATVVRLDPLLDPLLLDVCLFDPCVFHVSGMGLSTAKEGASLSARCSEQLNVCLSALTDLRLSFSPGTKIRGDLGEFDLQDLAELGRLLLGSGCCGGEVGNPEESPLASTGAFRLGWQCKPLTLLSRGSPSTPARGLSAN
jgi:hypothetical protein